MSDGICEECGTDNDATVELIDELIAQRIACEATIADLRERHQAFVRKAKGAVVRAEIMGEIDKRTAATIAGMCDAELKGGANEHR